MGQAPLGWPETPGPRGWARLAGAGARCQLQGPGRAQAGVQSRLGAGARVAANCPSTAKRSLSPTRHQPPGPCPGLAACSLPPVPPQPSSTPGAPRESGRGWPAPGRETQGKIMARGVAQRREPLMRGSSITEALLPGWRCQVPVTRSLFIKPSGDPIRSEPFTTPLLNKRKQTAPRGEMTCSRAPSQCARPPAWSPSLSRESLDPSRRESPPRGKLGRPPQPRPTFEALLVHHERVILGSLRQAEELAPGWGGGEASSGWAGRRGVQTAPSARTDPLAGRPRPLQAPLPPSGECAPSRESRAASRPPPPIPGGRRAGPRAATAPGRRTRHRPDLPLRPEGRRLGRILPRGPRKGHRT